MLLLLEKARVTTERQRLDGLLARQVRRMYQAFNIFLTDARSSRTMNEVQQLLVVTDHRGAQAIVDDHIAALGNVIPQVFVDVATQEATESYGRLLGIRKARLPAPRARVAVTFDPSNDRAAGLMRASKLRFIQQFTDSQRDATRTALAEAFGRGVGVREAARAFKDSIGLTRTQMQAVDNYRALLERGSKEALDREIRDRRFDSSVERAATTGEPLNAQQIDRMVDRYRERYVQFRAENIARTESLRVMSEARQEALEQIIEQTGIDPSLVQRTWHATKDKRTRDSHRDMDGQTVSLNEPFISGLGNKLMYPGDGPASDAINCRCQVTIEMRE